MTLNAETNEAAESQPMTSATNDDAPKTSPVQADSSGERHAFAEKEWSMCREQIHILLSAIWRFEVTAISGFALFFAWFLGSIVQKSISIEPIYLLFTSSIFSFLVYARLKIEYSILITLGNYSQILEAYLYGDVHVKKPQGWQSFLASEPPDEISRQVVFRRYRNTGLVFRGLIVMNVIALIYFGWPWLSDRYEYFVSLNTIKK